MSSLATDDFNRSDNSDLGTNWTVITSESNWSIVSNTASSGTANDRSERYNAITWPNDQYSKATISATGGAADDQTGVGTAVRMSTSQRTYYRGITNSSTGSSISKQVNGSYTLVAGSGPNYAVNDVVEMRAVGTTVSLWKNGSQQLSATDSSISSGQAGLSYSSSTATTPTLDNWEGGDFATGGIPSAVMAPYVAT